MKKLFILLLLFLCIGTLYGQGLNIGVVVPNETTEGVNTKAFQLLSTKLETMITKQGATSYNSGNIVLFPILNYNSDNIIEGGMRNIYSVDYELVVKVVSLSKNITFGTITWNLKGKGYSKSDAVKEGFGKLSTSDSKFSVFFNEIRTKIENYYIKNKASLIAQAKTLAAQKQYEEAISILYEYPSGINGYSEVQTTIGNIYKQYQKANCSQILQEARAKFAIKDYETASALISEVDATSPCANEAKTLSSQIRQSMNRDQAAERAQQLEERKISASIEKARINAVSKMVTAYYNRRPRVVYNTLIVRRW